MSQVIGTVAIRRESTFFVVLLGALSALPPLGIDMSLPALPALQDDLHVAAVAATQSLSIFLLGFAIGPVVFGPMSDRHGRRPLLLFGLGIFTLASAGCAAATSMDMLLLARLVQGIGAGAAAILPVAIVRDTFEGDAGRVRQSYVALVNAVAPLIAPLIGSLVLTVGDWRSIFWVLFAMGGSLFAIFAIMFEETAPKLLNTIKSRFLTSVLHNYVIIIKDRDYLAYTVILALTFGGMFAYITASSMIFIGVYQLSTIGYSLIFALTAVGTIGGAALSGKLVRSGISSALVLRSALAGSAVAAFALLIPWATGQHGLGALITMLVASNFCAGIIFPTATHESLVRLGETAGSAVALQRAIQMGFGALAGGLCGWLFEIWSTGALGLVMFGCAAAALLAYALSRRHHLIVPD